MKLAIIEDHNIVRKGLVEIISNFGNFTFVIEAENGKDFIEKYKQTELLPEICIVDIKMPEMNGFQLVQYLKTNFPKIKILILTTYDEEYFLIKMIKLVVNGYLIKDCHPEELNTEKEKSFLEISGEDLTYSQMAQKLKKSQRSIEGYRDSLFNKFEVNNRASLVLLAVKLGIIKI